MTNAQTPNWGVSAQCMPGHATGVLLPLPAGQMQPAPHPLIPPPIDPHRSHVNHCSWMSDTNDSQRCFNQSQFGCLGADTGQMHNADLRMNPGQIFEVVRMVGAALEMQRWTLRRDPHHWEQSTWTDVKRRVDEAEAYDAPVMERLAWNQ